MSLFTPKQPFLLINVLLTYNNLQNSKIKLSLSMWWKLNYVWYETLLYEYFLILHLIDNYYNLTNPLRNRQLHFNKFL